MPVLPVALSYEKAAKMDVAAVLQALDSSSETGLRNMQIDQRLKKFGTNSVHKTNTNPFKIFFRQITGNPLIMILSIATFISYALGQTVSAIYIFWMIVISVILGFWNEFSAEKTVDDLLKRIAPLTIVLRDNQKEEIAVKKVTIGDIVYLTPGTIVPAEIRLITADNLELDESALTGESESIYKQTETLTHAGNDIHKMKNICFMGTIVRSGSGKGVVFATAKDSEYGKIAEITSFVKPTTEFQEGLKKYGELIIKVIAVLTIGIFIINSIIGHAWIESLLFALAIAVGLTPELLPVIVTISLSHGAGKLSKKHVIAKQLIAIENLGNMDILCTDKTGTLTEGEIQVVDYTNIRGEKDESVLKAALICNTAIVHQKIIGDSIDSALWTHALKQKIPMQKVKKIAEEPFDYERKATFAVIKEGEQTYLFVKGAPENILKLVQKKNEHNHMKHEYADQSDDGYRVIAVAKKLLPEKKHYSWDDVNDLHFLGFIRLMDVPKKSAKNAIDKLKNLHVMTKVLTGDSEIITKKICTDLGLEFADILTGEQISAMTENELQKKAPETDIFARVSPEQKLRIIQALRNAGHTVGFMGDGINDGPSLHSADVGISVNSAVDVAKDAASIVLLRKSLDVISEGIIEGRKTFSNTIKYILMGTSSNFGNMFSAAGASFLLPFLPMTPVQILLNNALYDVSQMSIPSDNVDPEALLKPRHWNVRFIKNYMIFFGPLSSIFDFLTFGVMWFIFNAQATMFQTGWFVESLATQVLIVFVIRTSRSPFFKSKPGKWLAITCISVVCVAILLPFSPLSTSLGFTPLPPVYFVFLISFVGLYMTLVEVLKKKLLQSFIG